MAGPEGEKLQGIIALGHLDHYNAVLPLFSYNPIAGCGAIHSLRRIAAGSRRDALRHGCEVRISLLNEAGWSPRRLSPFLKQLWGMAISTVTNLLPHSPRCSRLVDKGA